MNNRILFFLISVVISLLFYGVEGLQTEEILSIGIFTFFLLDFIDSISKNYNILDIPILLAVFQCLIMPIVVYKFYNDDLLVVALKYDMSVKKEVYYGYMFPSIMLMIIGMKIPPLFQNSYETRFRISVHNVKSYLKGKGNLGVLLMIIGFVATLMKNFIGGELQYIAYLFSLLLYVGVLYTFYSDHKQRFWFLMGGGFVIFIQALAQGMFGELLYVVILTFMLLLLGRKVKKRIKFGLAFLGILSVIILQTVKADYRAITWRGQGKLAGESNIQIFFTLIADRVTDPEGIFNLQSIFPTVNRFNQGMIIGKVLDNVPKNAPFAEGETIFLSLAATFVPRILWPDKPTSGGHYNMERFAGYRIEGVSMNISPMGEAYGNYGVQGGIFFMFCYGLFFSLLIILLMNYVRKKPTLILWFPVLFINSVQIETDILMVLNSLIKNILFVAFCYWAASKFLRLKL